MSKCVDPDQTAHSGNFGMSNSVDSDQTAQSEILVSRILRHLLYPQRALWHTFALQHCLYTVSITSNAQLWEHSHTNDLSRVATHFLFQNSTFHHFPDFFDSYSRPPNFQNSTFTSLITEQIKKTATDISVLTKFWNSLFPIFAHFPETSLTFPWPGKIFIFQTFFPDHGNPALDLTITESAKIVVGSELNRRVNTNKVMSSQSVYLTHFSPGQSQSSMCLPVLVHILLPQTDNCPSWISGREWQ